MSSAAAPSISPPSLRIAQPKRWTVAEFHTICAEPAFENRRLILIDGEILEMPAPNPPHDMALGLAELALRAAFGPSVWVRGQMALVLGLSTDPIPAHAVVPGSPRDYSEQPRSALLVVEVAESSLAYDLRDKANVYAAGGIADYWVIDLIHRQLHLFRDPALDAAPAFGAMYRTRQSLDASAKISPLAAPAADILVASLLP